MSDPDPLPEQVADRRAIRDLVDAYAHLADRRDAQAQAGLFTDDARVAVYDGEPDTTEPAQVLNGRDELAAPFGSLRNMSIRYHDTFVRQGGRWFFAERRLITDWVDRRPSTA